MFRFKNTYKYKKKACLGLICMVSLFVFNDVSGFQISGGGNNLRVIQSNQAQSTSFQVNAKLKPTAVAKKLVPITSGAVVVPVPVVTPPVVTPPTTPPTSPETTIPAGADGSSPRLGTANWDYNNRSAQATAERKRIAAENLQTNAFASAPKEPAANSEESVLDSIDTETVNNETVSPKNETEKNISNQPIEIVVQNVIDNSESEKNLTINNTDKEVLEKENNTAEINTPETSVNIAESPLRFLPQDIITKSPEMTSCNDVTIAVYNPYDWYDLAQSLFFVLIALTLILICLIILIVLMITRKNNKETSITRVIKKLFPVIAVTIISLGTITSVHAQNITTPQQLVYEGDLLDNSGNPLTGSYSFRFSLWDNGDYEAGDTITGSINTGAPDFFGWQEVQTSNLTDGTFSLRMGTVTPFIAGLFDRTAMYLQIEVKESSTPDTSYEFIDLDVTSATIDRTGIDTIPFAFNADKLDFRDTGFNAGEIPYLDGTGKLDTTLIPNGINDNNFILDNDGNALGTDLLSLTFGNTLNKSLVWNGLAGRFEFNDNVAITGDLTVTGTINGQSFAAKDKTAVLSPRYPNSIIDKDGSDNSGSMFEESVLITGNQKNTLRWNSKQTTLQDYDVIIRYTLPANFAEFQADPVALEFKTDGTFNDAKIDFVIQKEGSTVDELSGSGIGFNSNTWANVDMDLLGTTTWNPNDIMVIKLKMHSRNNLQSYVSDISLKYIES